MRTPIRLAATLLKSQIAQSVRGRKAALPLRCIAVPEEAEKHSAHAGPSAVGSKRVKVPASRILWLTGAADPLSRPAIGKFARQLQEHGRTVFLETDGTQLRRRIHEFRPSQRLYLTVRLYGTAPTHDQRMQKEGAFAAAMEGIRAAQLSGFLLCAHLVVEHDKQLHDINHLLEELCTLRLDGMIVTAADDTVDIQRKTAAVARGLLGSRWWAAFSQVVQRSFNLSQAGVASTPAGSSRVGVTAPASNNANKRDAHGASVSSEEVATR